MNSCAFSFFLFNMFHHKTTETTGGVREDKQNTTYRMCSIWNLRTLFSEVYRNAPTVIIAMEILLSRFHSLRGAWFQSGFDWPSGLLPSVSLISCFITFPQVWATAQRQHAFIRQAQLYHELTPLFYCFWALPAFMSNPTLLLLTLFCCNLFLSVSPFLLLAPFHLSFSPFLLLPPPLCLPLYGSTFPLSVFPFLCLSLTHLINLLSFQSFSMCVYNIGKNPAHTVSHSLSRLSSLRVNSDRYTSDRYIFICILQYK